MTEYSRRQLIKFGLCVTAAYLIPTPKMAIASSPIVPAVRELALHNLHTGEKIRAAFYENGQYIPSAIENISHVLRDFRTGEVHTIDPQLFEQLYNLQQMVERPGEFHVISGYRSPKTNKMLHNNSDGVATKSLHMQGKAIDIRLPGVDLNRLHKAALNMQAGGVGYYPSSDFLHLDTGRVRRWG